jgi:hypothetical protein
MGDFVEADEGKGIAVGILEAGEDATPDGSGVGSGRGRIWLGGTNLPYGVFEAAQAGSLQEMHAALCPFAELGEEIFGNERDMGGTADKFVPFGGGFGGDEREIGGAVGGRNGGPSAAGLNPGVEDQLKAEAVDVEVEAAVEIVDVNADGLQAEVGVDAVEANGGAVEGFARVG